MLDRLLSALRIGTVDASKVSLYDFRRAGPVPAWAQAVLVVAGFLATVACTHAEFREKGTTFGVAGPAFNTLFCPIYEEAIFRGWILGQVLRRGSGALAIGVSSVLFGLVHVRNVFWLDGATVLRSMAYTGLVLGPILGYVTLRLRTIWPAVVLHYANNLIRFL